LIMRG